MSEPRVAPVDPEDLDERAKEVLASVARPDGTVLRIFGTLAHHPKLLKRWSAFGGTLLYGGELPARDREVLILRTGWRCDAEYEWGQHVEIGKACGLTDDDIARIAGPVDDTWPQPDRVLARAADELHDDACLSDATWAELAEKYSVQQLIEVCMVVGQYHLVAFTLNSLGVVPEPGLEPIPPQP
jgi:4-carboxymuconolactone decarboxylase